MLTILSWARAVSELLFWLPHRDLLAVDGQAITFSLAFLADRSVSKSRSFAGVTGNRDLFIHTKCPLNGLQQVPDIGIHPD
jgi:hypothetical protein